MYAVDNHAICKTGDCSVPEFEIKPTDSGKWHTRRFVEWVYLRDRYNRGTCRKHHGIDWHGRPQSIHDSGLTDWDSVGKNRRWVLPGRLREYRKKHKRQWRLEIVRRGRECGTNRFERYDSDRQHISRPLWLCFEAWYRQHSSPKYPVCFRWGNRSKHICLPPHADCCTPNRMVCE